MDTFHHLHLINGAWTNNNIIVEHIPHITFLNETECIIKGEKEILIHLCGEMYIIYPGSDNMINRKWIMDYIYRVAPKKHYVTGIQYNLGMRTIIINTTTSLPPSFVQIE